MCLPCLYIDCDTNTTQSHLHWETALTLRKFSWWNVPYSPGVNWVPGVGGEWGWREVWELVIIFIKTENQRVAITSPKIAAHLYTCTCRTCIFWLSLLANFLISQNCLCGMNCVLLSRSRGLEGGRGSGRRVRGESLICLRSHNKSVGKERIHSLHYAALHIFTCF